MQNKITNCEQRLLNAPINLPQTTVNHACTFRHKHDLHAPLTCTIVIYDYTVVNPSTLPQLYGKLAIMQWHRNKVSYTVCFYP